MKTTLMILTLFFFTSCASLMPTDEALENAGTCKVWKDGMLGSKYEADIKDELAEYKHSCRFITFWCSYVYAKYKDKNDIYTSNSGLITAEMRAAIFDGKKYVVDSSLVTTPPFEIANGKAHYSKTVLGRSSDETVRYNKACSPRQAALGVAVLYSK